MPHQNKANREEEILSSLNLEPFIHFKLANNLDGHKDQSDVFPISKNNCRHVSAYITSALLSFVNLFLIKVFKISN
jgi:hypothetical protein